MSKHLRQPDHAATAAADYSDVPRACRADRSTYAGSSRGQKVRRCEHSSKQSDNLRPIGLILDSHIAAKRAAHLLQEMEPTSEEIALEKTLVDSGLPKKRADSRPTSQAGKDLLAAYMQQLGHIPLYTPQQELEAAKELERAELETWLLILRAPKAVAYLLEECVDSEPQLRYDIEHLEQSYRIAAARTHRRKLEATPSRAEVIERISKALRFADFDKVLLERVVAKMRREVWGRRVLSSNTAYRLTHADLTDIERSRGVALRTRNNFVRANLRLVISIARRSQHYRVAFIDLIQEGNMGLMKAVHRFDHRRGFRFSTYAHWWIRQSIERAIVNKGSHVRLPVHVIESRRHVSRALANLLQTLGRRPTTNEIAQACDLPGPKVEQILHSFQQDPISLDESVSSADPRKILDLVRDESVPAVDEALIRENTHERVRELLHMLNPIEKDIIRRRFGLGADTDETLEEIGKIYNLSRERVRQIQTQGLVKMRRMCERRYIQ